MTTSSVIERIRERVDIVDFVGSYVSLKKMGKYFKAPCPFHQEKTPSFVVSPDRQRWHCFGSCHEGGDIFSFLMKWENLTFPEAVREIGTRAGIPLEELTQGVGTGDVQVVAKDAVYEVNEIAARYFHYILTQTPQGEIARQYLHGRQIKDQIWETFALGYAPDSWDSLYQYLKKKKYSDEILLTTGLFVQGGRGLYDRFRGRLMFPIASSIDKVIGFSGRLLKQEVTEKDGGKYVNTPETLVYHKRESLYGIHKAKDAIKKLNSAIAVEGEFDMITPYMHGITNIVAIKGSAFTTEQLKIIRRYTDRLVLALDADAAGIDALKKTAQAAQEFEYRVYICVIPGGKDPDEAVKQDASAFKKAVEDAVPIYDYIIDSSAGQIDIKDPFAKKKFAEDVIPYIESIKNPIVKEHYVHKLSTVLQTPPESILAYEREIARKKKRSHYAPAHAATPPVPAAQSRIDILQKYTLARLVQSDARELLIPKAIELLQSDDFARPSYRKLFEQLTLLPGGPIPTELQEVFDEVYLYNSMIDEKEDIEAHVFIKHARELAREATKAKLRDMLQSATSDTDDALMDRLQKRLAALEKMS